MAKVEDHTADALAKGATAVVGGNRYEIAGTFFDPSVLSGVTKAMKVAPEEPFGLVAPLFRFETVEDVIAQANATEFGLASYF